MWQAQVKSLDSLPGTVIQGREPRVNALLRKVAALSLRVGSSIFSEARRISFRAPQWQKPWKISEYPIVLPSSICQSSKASVARRGRRALASSHGRSADGSGLAPKHPHVELPGSSPRCHRSRSPWRLSTLPVAGLTPFVSLLTVRACLFPCHDKRSLKATAEAKS